MMPFRNIIFFIVLLSNMKADDILIKKVIEKTNIEYQKVRDFEAKMSVHLKVPGLRMPKKTYKVYYKHPNKFKADTKGFGILPNTGIFTSPKDNFDNLKNLELSDKLPKRNNHCLMITGTLIPDSLKAQFPSEYAKLTFDPLVDVVIDTNKWVIKSVTSRIDTVKLFDITNHYKLYEGKFQLPHQSKVEYFIKDARLAGWLKKDVKTLMNTKDLSNNSDVIKGTITVNYLDYKINRNIPDRVFKKKKN